MEMQPQAIPFAKKDLDWAIKNTEYFIGMSIFGTTNQVYNNKLEMQKAYEAYDGDLNMEEYRDILEPLGINTPKNIGPEQHVRNFPIIKPTIDLLYGEYAKKPKNVTVIALDSDVETMRLTEMNNALSSATQQMAINELNSKGIDTNKPSIETQTLQQITDSYSRVNWKDKRAITGQGALNYILRENEVPRKFKKGFLDFLIAGLVCTLKEANGNEIDYMTLDPRDVDYDKNAYNDFIEDGGWAIVRYRATVSQIIDVFYKDMENADEINDLFKNTTMSYADSAFTSFTDKDRYLLNPNEVEVVRVFWKSMKMIGYVTYIDEFGKKQIKEVDESYKIDKTISEDGLPLESVEWIWVNEVWESTRIAGKIYKRIKPFDIQRTSIDNPSKCKLPINGRNYYARNARQLSLVSLGIPFQIIYNIYKSRQEDLIRKNKGRIAKLNLKAKPKDWSFEEWLFYATELGFMVEDGNEQNVSGQQGVLDLEFSQSLSVIGELLRSVKEEWDELSGISKQRKGQTMASETNGANERAVNQSALNTEIYNDLYEDFELREYNGLLDTSKVTWIEGKKAWFYLPEYGQQFLDVDGIQHSETNYGIFASNSSKDQGKFKYIQSLGERMLQQGVPASAVIDMIDSENMSKIKELIKNAEALQQQQKAQQTQQEQQQEAAIEKAKIDMIEEGLNRTDYNKEQDRVKDIRVAEIQALGRAQDPVDIIDQSKLALEDKKLDLKEKELSQKQLADDESANIDREKIQSNENIEQMKIKAGAYKPSSK
jgi:hypothetical protein